MSAVLTPRQTEQGWVIEMTPEMISSLGVAEGSKILLTSREGGISAELLPPLSSELASLADQIFEENRGFYEEMKRLGD